MLLLFKKETILTVNIVKKFICTEHGWSNFINEVNYKQLTICL